MIPKQNLKHSAAYIPAFLLIFTLLSCSTDNDESVYQPTFTENSNSNTDIEYVFGVHPLHNPQRLHEVFSPLMQYLGDNIDNASFRLEASRNYAAYNKKLYALEFDFALPNPFQTINAIDKGYKVFGKMGDDHNFRGIILVRKDSHINQISDLKGKSISYPAPTALAATMMPQYYLQTHGISVMKDLDNRYVGSQESSIMNVFLKHTSAAATWPLPWISLSRERPELKEELEVKWETDTLPNNGLVVKSDIPDKLVSEVSVLLFNLHKTNEGKAILNKMELTRFETANEETYQPVSDFLKRFQKEVRALD